MDSSSENIESHSDCRSVKDEENIANEPARSSELTENSQRNDSSPTVFMEGLSALDEIKEISLRLHELKSRQLHAMQVLKLHEQNMCQLQKEADDLKKERVIHVEELRSIHADLNLVDSTLRNTEKKMADSVMTLQTNAYHYGHLTQLMRSLSVKCAATGVIVPDLECLSTGTIGHQYFNAADDSLADPTTATSDVPSGSVPSSGDKRSGNPSEHRSQDDGASRLYASLPTNHHFAFPYTANGSFVQWTDTNQDAPTPPMKTCQSCQQQIHRNAPICPICKAKSRSRNSKYNRRRGCGGAGGSGILR